MGTLGDALKLLKRSRKILEIDRETRNPNKIFKNHENTSRGFQKLDLSIQKRKIFKKLNDPPKII